jgi:hypothetical protein
MSDNKSKQDNETIMIALDQISQTIEVMTKVVARLRHQIEDQQQSRSVDTAEVDLKIHTLH